MMPHNLVLLIIGSIEMKFPTKAISKNKRTGISIPVEIVRRAETSQRHSQVRQIRLRARNGQGPAGKSKNGATIPTNQSS
jgi:hypothetical protein